MDVIAHLETIEAELTEVRRRLDWLYNLVEATGLDMAEVTPRIQDARWMLLERRCPWTMGRPSRPTPRT